MEETCTNGKLRWREHLQRINKKVRRYSGPLPWFSSKAMSPCPWLKEQTKRCSKSVYRYQSRVSPCQCYSTFHLGMHNLNSFIILHTHKSSYSSLPGQSGYERIKFEITQDNEKRKQEAHGQREAKRHTLGVCVGRECIITCGLLGKKGSAAFNWHSSISCSMLFWFHW